MAQLILVGVTTLFIVTGCAAAEPLDLDVFPVADAGPSDAPSCRSACYAACPPPQSDVEARDCVWNCNRACYDAGR